MVSQNKAGKAMVICTALSIGLGIIGCWFPTVLGLNIPVIFVFIIALDS